MWDDAFPSFLIGLREGLEAGLIVSILVATVVRFDRRSRLPQIWTGVLAAIALSMSFAAVLTFSSATMSTQAQEAFGGSLSLVAVALVTVMVFWMRRSARTLSGEIRDKVAAALAMGSGMLVLTAFLSVGREGLETALFLWTTEQAAGESTGPLIGAGVGLVLAAALCWGLYRRVLKINLSVFFSVTGAVLIVIAAGVLGYGLRDLQEGGVLPGAHALAVDLGVDPSSWYATLVQGVMNLTPQMTWVQVIGYLVYLAVVMTLFTLGLRVPSARAVTGTAQDSAEVPATASSAASSGTLREPDSDPRPDSGPEPEPDSEPPTADGPASAPSADAAEPSNAPSPTAGRRRPVWVLPVAVVAVPVVVAGVVIAVTSGKPKSAATVAVSASDCGKGFGTPGTGRQVFQMHNTGGKAAEVYLVNPTNNAVYGEIEGLAPGTTRPLVATLGAGSYAWRCVPAGHAAVTSPVVRVSGGGAQVAAVLPVDEADLAGPLDAYRAYVDRGLAVLEGQTRTLAADLARGDGDAARRDWLTAHLTYSSLGAAYGTFADFDQKINGRADGLPGGRTDPDFTGFHRIEDGLWHGAAPASLARFGTALAGDVTALRADFPKQDFDVADLPLRTHEILENTLQFQLTGDEDYGSGTTLATTAANIDGTSELLSVLRPLLTARDAALPARIDAWITRTRQAVGAQHRADGSWTPVAQVPQQQRQSINADMGQLLEELAVVPDLLEIRKSG